MIKSPSILLALVGSALAGMHGYNTCYIATGPGEENLNTSSVGFHIDSTRNLAKDSVTNRNVFADGYLSSNDWDGGSAFSRRGDSLFYVVQGTVIPYGLVVQDGKVVAKFGAGMRSRVEFYADSIVDRDTTGTADPEISWTRDRFTADSLHSSYWTPTSNGWVDNIRCRAGADSCTCNFGRTFVYGPGTITELYQGIATTLHYTSVGPTLGILRRPAVRAPAGRGPWRVDGSKRHPARGWMPNLRTGAKNPDALP